MFMVLYIDGERTKCSARLEWHVGALWELVIGMP